MSFHAGQTFTFGEQPSATKWQYLWDNDYALADGTGISDNAIDSRHYVDNSIDPEHLATDSIYLGHATITSNFTTTTNALVTGLAKTVTMPPGGRKLKVTAFSLALSNSASPTNSDLSIEENGTEVARVRVTSGGANYCAPALAMAVRSPASGASLAYTVRLYNVGGATAQIQATATSPALLLVEVM